MQGVWLLMCICGYWCRHLKAWAITAWLGLGRRLALPFLKTTRSQGGKGAFTHLTLPGPLFLEKRCQPQVLSTWPLILLGLFLIPSILGPAIGSTGQLGQAALSWKLRHCSWCPCDIISGQIPEVRCYPCKQKRTDQGCVCANRMTAGRPGTKGCKESGARPAVSPSSWMCSSVPGLV